MLLGMWLMGNKNKWCFPVLACMNILVIVLSIRAGIYGVAVTNAIYIVMGIRNFMKWSNK